MILGEQACCLRAMLSSKGAPAHRRGLITWRDLSCAIRSGRGHGADPRVDRFMNLIRSLTNFIAAVATVRLLVEAP